ncbi:glycosyltransferase family 2 protein [Falsiroseomonas oryzae]|uniref:glycosyltransferase family 2 protein n=1 Tax=Falsiroseomonas oryzae TaxID=2766473 RepID=UPI0022EB10C4|nr:glycosyltransferase [Roseomonas sp. MO-31]
MSVRGAWRVIHHDIAEQAPELAASPGHAGVILMLWRCGVPLGKLDYLAAELPVPAAAVAASIPAAVAASIGDRLVGRGFEGLLPTRSWRDRAVPDLAAILAQQDVGRALDAVLAPPPPPAVGLSLVICTRDRPDALARCLGSLGPNFDAIAEVIVVDNGATPAVPRALAAAAAKLRVVAEPRRGLSIARNTGLRHARQEIVAFTDDDVVLHPDWAARLIAGFTSADTACVTGLVLPAELETEAQVVFERGLRGFGQGLQRITYDPAFFRATLPYGVPTWRIGAGANMAMRRDVVERLGGFDERLGAGAAGCSEDSELWYRMLAAGWTCRYEPAAVVFHTHRRDWPALRRQMRDYMRGHVAALLVQYARHGHRGNLRRLAATIPAHYAQLLIDAALGRDRYGRVRLMGAELRGALSGLGALRWVSARSGPAQPATRVQP